MSAATTDTPTPSQGPTPYAIKPPSGVVHNPHVRRFVACLALGFVLALMIGEQEGTQQDFGLAFREAVALPRILIFLGIGILVFLAITFWPRIEHFLIRPGIRPLFVGLLSVAVSQTLLKWSDSSVVGNGKFGTLAGKAADTPQLAPFARAYFTTGVAWAALIVVVVVAAYAIFTGQRAVAWVGAGLAVVVGLWAFFSQGRVVSLLQTPDHSTGALVALLGYLAIAAACAACALRRTETADTKGFIDRVFAWRPGMPLAAVGIVVGLVSLGVATWFSPQNEDLTLVDTASFFSGHGLAPLSQAYLSWLGYLLFVVAAVLAVLGCLRRDTRIAWATAVVGIVGAVLTLMTLYSTSSLGAKSGFDGASGAWQNLGGGGWFAAAAFTILAGAGYIVLSVAHDVKVGKLSDLGSDIVGQARQVPGMGKALVLLVVAAALFYPPTATEFWQKVIVSEIGIYVLLAIGLNVVVGWAGLLDLGFIAFYAIGSYTTAYLVGALPITPPEWLRLPPLAAIPFAIVICLIAGVALGFPTLRLRGDYLAIVTLGFGEIIRLVAINNPANFTNGPRGAFGIPQPSIHLGPLHIDWGSSSLQYWYLLLVLIGVTVLLFNRLEQSRLGRAWAAIREDEVAAQASGVNTVRVKLLAFAIGASTSGVAGVFFASQIGYINPDNFILNNSILVVAYVVFGGMGSLPGAMAGAAVLTWLPEFLKDQVPAEDRQMWIGAVILLMMIFRPQGLIPAKRRAAELHGLDDQPREETRAVPAGEGMGGGR
ncbi:ABC-type branched-chain amino acid transport system, permease component (livM) [Nostocoides japonicum T1-X7]|uniref:ABC-type branched-chain amino acid transport system, permease component (LivM) n=1 Tax=Nostocoides japonicum T1-X7 TaxID=1194083 RepID=A0A077M7F0_9MICO|nr:branched-chain amino acid ABC transporter permease [Tetrasphaera japonica]CCH80069.1 ABC-type branched-chain amino acid transport system, permease component (livM) [Tetrasphaera japonica T1-X7]